MTYRKERYCRSEHRRLLEPSKWLRCQRRADHTGHHRAGHFVWTDASPGARVSNQESSRP